MTQFPWLAVRQGESGRPPPHGMLATPLEDSHMQHGIPPPLAPPTGAGHHGTEAQTRPVQHLCQFKWSRSRTEFRTDWAARSCPNQAPTKLDAATVAGMHCSVHLSGTPRKSLRWTRAGSPEGKASSPAPSSAGAESESSMMAWGTCVEKHRGILLCCRAGELRPRQQKPAGLHKACRELMRKVRKSRSSHVGP